MYCPSNICSEAKIYRNLRNIQVGVLFLSIITTRTTLPYVTLESRHQANKLADMQFPIHHLISLNHLIKCTFWFFLAPCSITTVLISKRSTLSRFRNTDVNKKPHHSYSCQHTHIWVAEFSVFQVHTQYITKQIQPVTPEEFPDKSIPN